MVLTIWRQKNITTLHWLHWQIKIGVTLIMRGYFDRLMWGYFDRNVFMRYLYNGSFSYHVLWNICREYIKSTNFNHWFILELIIFKKWPIPEIPNFHTEGRSRNRLENFSLCPLGVDVDLYDSQRSQMSKKHNNTDKFLFGLNLNGLSK